MTNFSFEYFYKIFTEDASPPLLYNGAKKSKMTKNSNQGGPALSTVPRIFYQSFHMSNHALSLHSLPSLQTKSSFFTSSSSLQLFADGLAVLPDDWVPGRTGQASLTERASHLLAVHIPPSEEEEQAASKSFILSLDQHIITKEFSATDSSWRCISGEVLQTLSSSRSEKFRQRWFRESFDDHSWPTARVLGANGGRGRLTVAADVAGHAKWITAHGGGDEGVYCRGVVSAFPGK